MKTTNLRVGNFIVKDGCVFKIPKDCNINELKNIAPIPITERLAKLAGFTFACDSYSLVIQEDRGGGEGEFILDIQFYHEGLGGFKEQYPQVAISAPESEWLTLHHIKHIHELQNLYYTLKNKELSLRKFEPVKTLVF